ncbi:S-protein homolog 5-like [Diospyros lotus]|uniref:S-protein homolog 5-like n=1 Tax=Diospyros lotus TaxID=55363 RepID=UPI002258F8DD|nr:S-protein homolog 5-like [Diospyros lotus]
MGCSSIPLVFLMFLFVYTASSTFEVTVHIISLVTDDPLTLFFRCKSENEDLGYQQVYSDEEYNWTFKSDTNSYDFFFCHFYWNGKEIVFPVYDHAIGEECAITNSTHHDCYWTGKPDGFYFWMRPEVLEKRYDW